MNNTCPDLEKFNVHKKLGDILKDYSVEEQLVLIWMIIDAMTKGEEPHEHSNDETDPG